jgi:hypothetical protein
VITKQYEWTCDSEKCTKVVILGADEFSPIGWWRFTIDDKQEQTACCSACLKSVLCAMVDYGDGSSVEIIRPRYV